VNIKDDRQFLLVSRPSRNKPDNHSKAPAWEMIRFISFRNCAEWRD
jgi:hypothetical protein